MILPPFETVFKALNSKRVKYMVVGGVAAFMHGVPRGTHDLDLLVELSSGNVRKLVSVLDTLGYLPRLPVKPIDLANAKKRKACIKDKHMKDFTFFDNKNPLHQIDIILLSSLSYAEASKTMQVRDYGGVPVPLISIENLIKMKQGTGRTIDESDAEILKRIRKMGE